MFIRILYWWNNGLFACKAKLKCWIQLYVFICEICKNVPIGFHRFQCLDNLFWLQHNIFYCLNVTVSPLWWWRDWCSNDDRPKCQSYIKCNTIFNVPAFQLVWLHYIIYNLLYKHRVYIHTHTHVCVCACVVLN